MLHFSRRTAFAAVSFVAPLLLALAGCASASNQSSNSPISSLPISDAPGGSVPNKTVPAIKAPSSNVANNTITGNNAPSANVPSDSIANSGAPSGSVPGAAPANNVPSPNPVEEIEVELDDFEFEPEILAVPQGTKVALRLRNRDRIPHSFTLFDLGVDVLLNGRQTKTITIEGKTAGTFRLICKYHPNMVGKLVVQ